MYPRILISLAATLAFLGFLRMPSLDTAILAFPALFALSILIEESWDKLKPPPPDSAPLCPTCGYDLRATPTHCPECGTIPPAQLIVERRASSVER